VRHVRLGPALHLRRDAAYGASSRDDGHEAAGVIGAVGSESVSGHLPLEAVNTGVDRLRTKSATTVRLLVLP
jgi:hypothetical protein